MPRRLFLLVLALLVASGISVAPAVAGPPSEGEVAAAVDAAVRNYWQNEGLEPVPAADPEIWLRRAALDLAGRPPTPGERADFLARPFDAAARAAAADHLTSPAADTPDAGFARNWANYYRDVIFTRATDPRGQLSRGPFGDYLAERLGEGAGWDDITTEVLTATGDLREDGETGLFAAHRGETAEVAGEAARVFLGVQVGCAECHDHPYDRWTREQFHQLAAYFPRTRIRRVNPPGSPQRGPRTFELVANDRAGGAEQIEKRIAGLKTLLARRFRFLDQNRDGELSKNEVKNLPGGGRAARLLDAADADKSGGLNRDEIGDIAVPPQVLKNAGGSEHYMPDLERPEARGTRIDPAFFLTGKKARRNMTDADRRAAAAEAITGSGWFAKATVNRVWTEMTGHGFYEPVDDIGPDRSARLEAAMNALCDGFEKNDHSLPWLAGTISRTELYSLRSDAAAAPLTAVRPARLRADQVYQNVAGFVGLGDAGAGADALSRFARGNRRPAGPYAVARRGLAGLVDQTFGVDPSTDKAEVTGDVPQALFLMNGTLAANLVRAEGNISPVARLVRRVAAAGGDDAAVVAALYEAALARRPTGREEEAALDYINRTMDPRTAYEDLAWAVLNGPEFVTKR